MEKQVPNDIMKIVDEARANAEEAKRIERQDREQKIKERRHRGEKYLQLWINSQLGSLKENEKIILPYYATVDDSRDWDSLCELYSDERGTPSRLLFSVPGLAPITLDCEKHVWESAIVDKRDGWENPNYVTRARRATSLEVCLANAFEAAREYAQAVDTYQMRMQREDEQKARAQIEAVAEGALAEIKADAEKTEEEELFEMVKRDRLAVLLLKSYLFVNQERGYFQARLEDAVEDLESMDAYWARKATELRRTADEADKRAAEERSRASDLEYDLDKAKKTLKNSERGI